MAVAIAPLDRPAARRLGSGDLHVHMNYGGAYRNEPDAARVPGRGGGPGRRLEPDRQQGAARAGHRRTSPDGPIRPRRRRDLLRHGQEYHTSYWGHLGLLGLGSHLLLPDYAGYANTAAASLYPTNAAVADLARAQGALVGYVHPVRHAAARSAATRSRAR